MPFQTAQQENCNCNYTLFTKLPWPGDSEGTFRSSSQAATCPPVYHTRRRLHTVPLIAESQARKAVNTNFYCLWFDPTGNRTRVYRFSSRRSIHSTTDRFVLHTVPLMLNAKQLGSCEYQFLSHWFVPTANRTPVFRLQGGRSNRYTTIVLKYYTTPSRRFKKAELEKT